MKALLWKELREIWLLWLVFFCVLICISPLFLESEGYSLVVTIFLLSIYSGFLGARAFAGEREQGNFTYLQTRPISTRTVLWIKYFIGLLQITVLLLLIIFLTQNSNGFQFIFGSAHDKLSSPTLVFTCLWGLYSFCFLISIFATDTVRAFLIGFPSALFIEFVVFECQRFSNPNILLDSQTLLFIQFSLVFLTLILFLVGITGIAYHSYCLKRFTWKTGFLLFFLLGFLLIHHFHNLFYGDTVPVGQTSNVDSFRFSSNVGLYYWNHRIYKVNSSNIINMRKFLYIDVTNPATPRVRNGFNIPWNTNLLIDKNRLYTFDYPVKSSQAVSVKDIYFKVYDLNSSDYNALIFQKQIYQYAEKIPNTYGTPYVSTKESSIFLTYYIATGKTPYGFDENGRPLADSGGYEYLYKTHVLELDKSTFKKIREFDINSIGFNFSSQEEFTPERYFCKSNSSLSINVYDISSLRQSKPHLSIRDVYDYSNHATPILVISTLHLNPNSKIPIYEYITFQQEGNYLYIMNHANMLEVYDLTRKTNSLVAKVPWNWVDMLGIQTINTNDQGLLTLDIQDNRAFIFNKRGFMIFDISNPTKPKLLSRMMTDHIQEYTIHDNYLYATGIARHFAIYRIP